MSTKEKNEKAEKALKKGKKEAKEKTRKKLCVLSEKTLKELERIAFDQEVQLKTRTDILKWLTELSIGKGGKGLEEEEVTDNKIDIRVHVEG